MKEIVGMSSDEMTDLAMQLAKAGKTSVAVQIETWCFDHLGYARETPKVRIWVERGNRHLTVTTAEEAMKEVEILCAMDLLRKSGFTVLEAGNRVAPPAPGITRTGDERC